MALDIDPLVPGNSLSIVSRLLLKGLDDWVAFWQVEGAVRLFIGLRSVDAHRDGTMIVFRELLTQGWFRPGDLRKGMGFVPWNTTLEEVIAEADKRWPDGGRLTYVCWLELTDAGRQEAQRLRDSL